MTEWAAPWPDVQYGRAPNWLVRDTKLREGNVDMGYDGNVPVMVWRIVTYSVRLGVAWSIARV